MGRAGREQQNHCQRSATTARSGQPANGGGEVATTSADRLAAIASDAAQSDGLDCGGKKCRLAPERSGIAASPRPGQRYGSNGCAHAIESSAAANPQGIL